MNDSRLPPSKVKSVSCQNCGRMTEIEGEQICFRDGKIIRLLPAEQKIEQPLLCEGWRGNKSGK
nr:hypothetical protein [Shewanella sedimentimangrovi]